MRRCGIGFLQIGRVGRQGLCSRGFACAVWRYGSGGDRVLKMLRAGLVWGVTGKIEGRGTAAGTSACLHLVCCSTRWQVGVPSLLPICSLH